MEIGDELIRSIFEQARIEEPVVSVEFVAMPDYAVNVVCFVNSNYVLRCSNGDAESRFRREKALLDSVGEFTFVPRILGSGPIPGTDGGFFQIQSRVAGHDMYSIWSETPESLRHTWISELAVALHKIHQLPVSTYRIGLYQTAIRKWSGSWITGHDRYIAELLSAAYARSPAAWERALLERAERFYEDHRTALTYESGARLGHGDLHLLNVLGTSSGMSGIIDWEWAYGGGVEPEYDLEGLIRWSLYPGDIGDDSIQPALSADIFADVIPTLLEAYPGLKSIPRLADRMTIYQIEHELHHIQSWKPAIPRRPLERLRAWVDDRVLEGMM